MSNISHNLRACHYLMSVTSLNPYLTGKLSQLFKDCHLFNRCHLFTTGKLYNHSVVERYSLFPNGHKPFIIFLEQFKPKVKRIGCLVNSIFCGFSSPPVSIEYCNFVIKFYNICIMIPYTSIIKPISVYHCCSFSDNVHINHILTFLALFNGRYRTNNLLSIKIYRYSKGDVKNVTFSIYSTV